MKHAYDTCKGCVCRLQEEAYVTWTTYDDFKKKNKKKEGYKWGEEYESPKRKATIKPLK